MIDLLIDLYRKTKNHNSVNIKETASPQPSSTYASICWYYCEGFL